MTLTYLKFDSTNNNSVFTKLLGPQIIYKLKWNDLCYILIYSTNIHCTYIPTVCQESLGNTTE